VKARPLLGWLVMGALLFSTFVAHRKLIESRSGLREQHAALSGVLTPGELASVTLLGGFRSIAVDIIWIRLREALDEQRFEELPALWSALKVIQGGSPTLHILEAREMALDIPPFLSHRPEERWMWIRRGLGSLSEGLKRYPQSLALLREEAYLYYQRFDPRGTPADRARFLAERPRPGEGVEYGRDPLQIAQEAGERAVADPAHTFDVDLLLWAIYKLSYGQAVDAARDGGQPGSPQAARECLQRAGRLLDHVRVAHRGIEGMADLLPLWQEQLEEGRRAQGLSRP
jgi:hypothetical protein